MYDLFSDLATEEQKDKKEGALIAPRRKASTPRGGVGIEKQFLKSRESISCGLKQESCTLLSYPSENVHFDECYREVSVISNPNDLDFGYTTEVYFNKPTNEDLDLINCVLDDANNLELDKIEKKKRIGEKAKNKNVKRVTLESKRSKKYINERVTKLHAAGKPMRFCPGANTGGDRVESSNEETFQDSETKGISCINDKKQPTPSKLQGSRLSSVNGRNSKGIQGKVKGGETAKPLEKNKDNAALPLDQLVTEYKNDVWKKFELLKISKNILINADIQRVKVYNGKPLFNSQSSCGTRTYSKDANAQLHSTKNAKLALTNVFRCASPWCCPSCSRKIRNAHTSNILRIAKHMQSNGFAGVFATLTFPHSLDTKGVFRHATDLWRSITGNKSYKTLKKQFEIHYVKAFEVTYSDAFGFHPHLHILFFVKHNSSDVSEFSDFELFSNKIRSIWSDANKKQGFDISEDAQNYKYVFNKDLANPAEYITKLSAAFELSQSGNKTANKKSVNPLQIPLMIMEGVNVPVKNPERVFSDFAANTKKQRSITYSRGLFDLCGIDREQEKEENLVNSTENIDKFLYAIEPKAFSKLVEIDAVKILLVDTYKFMHLPTAEALTKTINVILHKFTRNFLFKFKGDLLELQSYRMQRVAGFKLN